MVVILNYDTEMNYLYRLAGPSNVQLAVQAVTGKQQSCILAMNTGAL